MDFSENIAHPPVAERFKYRVHQQFEQKRSEHQKYVRKFGWDPEADHLQPKSRPQGYDPADHRGSIRWLLAVDARVAGRELAQIIEAKKNGDADQDYARKTALLRARIDQLAHFENGNYVSLGRLDIGPLDEAPECTTRWTRDDDF